MGGASAILELQRTITKVYSTMKTNKTKHAEKFTGSVAGTEEKKLQLQYLPFKFSSTAQQRRHAGRQRLEGHPLVLGTCSLKQTTNKKLNAWTIRTCCYFASLAAAEKASMHTVVQPCQLLAETSCRQD